MSKHLFRPALMAVLFILINRILWILLMEKSYHPTIFILWFSLSMIAVIMVLLQANRRKFQISVSPNPSFDKYVDLQVHFGLSKAELSILELIIQGKQNSEIAESRHISLNTVKTHVSHIYQKTGVRRRTQLLALIYEIQEQNHSKV